MPDRSPIRLLSTDFDGTLIAFGGTGACTRDLAEVLDDHRRSGGLWAVNTGRSMEHTMEGLARFGGPCEPDFILTNERDVHRRLESGGWEPHEPWNHRCREDHDALHEAASPIFREIEEWFIRRPTIKVIYEEGRLAGLVASSDQEMEQAVGTIRQIASAHPLLSFQRNAIYLRFCHAHYDKGSALGELCRLEGIAVAEVLAAGDHFNDLPMLRPERAGALACPANAIPEVREAVASAGGYVARREYGDGLADGIRHFSCFAAVV
ncbi:MAG: hypothetical protein Fur0032_20300 [Terrimicrobiaceae bacterium]